MLTSRRAPMPARGLSVVELMVGVTVGLIVVAGATLLVTNQLADNRRLLLETQVQQDLRAASDIVSRDVRRAGFWGAAETGLRASETDIPAPNPYVGVSLAGGSDSHPADEITYAYSRSAAENGAVDGVDVGGFRLRSGVIEMLMGGGGWQALTDANTLRVTRFEVRLNSVAIPLACPTACPAPSATCPPRQQVRTADVTIGGQAAHDAAVQRVVRNTVRLRNDVVTGACPA